MNCKLQARVEFSPWIGAEFDWQSADESLYQIIPLEKDKHSPCLLGEFNIEITLTKRRSHWFRKNGLEKAKINEHCLYDDAFRSRTYTIRLEQGNFGAPNFCQDTPQERFTHRLVFDKSPYPPRREWKCDGLEGPDGRTGPDDGADGNRFWDRSVFVSRRSQELTDLRRRELEEKNKHWWTGCVVS